MNSFRNFVSSRWLAPSVLGAVTVLFFWRYFLLDQTLYSGDTAFVFVPFRQFLTDHFNQGKLPLWNSHMFGGTPALAESQYQVFYPLNLLMVALGAARGMGWVLAFHPLIMGFGTFLFLRQSSNVGRLSALLGAVAFAFGASQQMRYGIPVYTNAAAWIPWVMWGYDRARLRGGAWFVVAPLALAVQIYSGGPQYTYYLLVLLTGYHWFCLRQQQSANLDYGRRAWQALGFTLFMGTMLSMAQIVPQFELTRFSIRGAASSYEYATAGSLMPRHLFFASFFPKFYGLFTSEPLDNFAAPTESVYLGAAVLALLAAASATPFKSPLRFWTAGALLATFLALGSYNPLYPLFFRFVPGISTFRAPGMWIVVASFCCAALAALGLQAILDGNPAARLRGFVASVTLVVVAATILLLPVGALAFVSPQTPYGPWGQVVVFAIVAVLSGLIWKSRDQGVLTARRLSAVLLVVLILDLFAVSRDMESARTVLATDLEVAPPSVPRLKAVSDPVAPGRFWNSEGALPMESWQRGQTLSPDEADVFRAGQGLSMRSLMPSCVASSYGTYSLTGAWGALMPLRRHPEPIYRADTAPAVKRQWLRLMNVRYYLAFGAAPYPDLTVVSSELPAIYSDAQALPRAFWIGRAVPTTRETALELVGSARFDPRREVALEGAIAPRNSRSDAPLRAASITRYDENHVEIEVSAPASGYLVLMDSVYPGWHARVDGQMTPIVPANYVGRAVAVESGAHKIEMWFEPESVRMGLFLSLIALGATAMVAGAGWKKGVS